MTYTINNCIIEYREPHRKRQHTQHIFIYIPLYYFIFLNLIIKTH
jgi:hypothetical protein